MSTPEATQTTFVCPACGQKHRADLSSLKGRPEAVVRTTCVGCKKPLAVGLQPDGQSKCILVPEAPPKDAAPKQEAPKPKETPAGKPNPFAFKAPVPGAKKGAAPAPAPTPSPKAEVATAPSPKPPPPPPPAPPASTATAPAPAPAPTPAPAPAPAPAPKAKSDAPVSAKASAREKRREEERAAREDKQVKDAEFGVDAIVGRYRIEEVIGQGGTGTVYRAFDPTTNRSVALKVLLKDMSETMRQRFVREIEVQANIRHPNIMPVFDRGALPDGRPFFTMELLYRPFTLTEIVERRERGTLGRYATLAHLGELQRLVKDVILPVADGLYVANVENGVIHRDLKPDNVLLDSRTMRPYLIDFGICSVLDKGGVLSGGVVVSPTAEDAGIVGTPRFLAPEQARGSVGPRTDVWGLGAMLHFCITGEPPIGAATGVTRSELRERVAGLRQARDEAMKAGQDARVDLIDEKLGRLEDPGLRTLDDLFKDARDARYVPLPSNTPTALSALIKKAMAAEPGDRYVNVRQVASELGAWIDGARVRALTEAGGAGAAADTAKRALKKTWAPTLVGIGGLVVGLLVGGGASRVLTTSSAGALQSLQVDVGSFKRELDTFEVDPQPLYGAEAARLHRLLTARAEGLAQRIAQEPAGASREALEDQFRFQRQRIAPLRVRLTAPEGATWFADRTNALGRERIELKAGDGNLLAPGDWSVLGTVREGEVLRERVRMPLRLAFTVRKQGVVADREAPAAAIEIPVALAQLPDDMVLVAGDAVLVRRPPYADASVTHTAVKSFLIGRTEVTNSEYAQYLLTLPEAEAAERTPASGFVRDPAVARSVVVRGAELLPVVGVRPVDARAYAAWRSKRDGAKVRLPTEAEWMVAAGAPAGWTLPSGRDGTSSDGVFSPVLADVAAHNTDLGPHGEQGLIGNAREMVEPVEGGVPSGAVLVKGAGLGDAPVDAAIGLVRTLGETDRHATTGFRLARDL